MSVKHEWEKSLVARHKERRSLKAKVKELEKDKTVLIKDCRDYEAGDKYILMQTELQAKVKELEEALKKISNGEGDPQDIAFRALGEK